MRPLEILTKCHEHNEAEGLPTNYNRLVNTVALLFPKFYDRHKRVISVKHAGIKSGRTVDPKLKLKFFINMLEFVHGKKFSCCTCGCRDYAMKVRSLRWNTFPMYCSDSCLKRGSECRDKCRDTVKKKYGVDNVSRSPEIRKKLSDNNYWSTLREEDPESFLEATTEREAIKRNLYGKNQEDTTAKRMKTNLERLGVPWPTMDPTVIELRDKNHMDTYGCRNPSQRPEVMAKIYANRRTSNLKRVTIGGVKFILQGYEPKALRYMVSKGLDILKVKKPNVAIEYVGHDGKSRMYHPDFHIKGANGREVMVEVKSTYTAGLDACKGTYYHRYDTLRAKAKAVLDSGYEFLLLVMKDSTGFEVLIEHVGSLPKNPAFLFR